MLRVCYLLLAFFCASVFSDLKYKAILEKCAIASYNTSIITNLNLECKATDDGFFVKSAGDLSHAINLDHVYVTGQIYVFENGDYVIRPKLRITLSLCNEYKLQTFGDWQEIEKYGNMKGCGTLEPGHYHVDDYPPKIKLMDVPVPAGKYKVNVKFHQDGAPLYEIDFFAEIQVP